MKFLTSNLDSNRRIFVLLGLRSPYTKASNLGTFSKRVIILLHAVHRFLRWQHRCCRASSEFWSNHLLVQTITGSGCCWAVEMGRLIFMYIRIVYTVVSQTDIGYRKCMYQYTSSFFLSDVWRANASCGLILVCYVRPHISICIISGVCTMPYTGGLFLEDTLPNHN